MISTSVWAIGKFRHYLGSRKFIIRTDSKTAKGFFKSMTNINGRDGNRRNRWILYMQQFEYEIIHISGNKNCVADTLSRIDFDE